MKLISRELLESYFKILADSNAAKIFTPCTIECWGGAWYTPANGEEVKYLQPLNPGVNAEDVEEYFTDLVIYRNQILRIEMNFKLSNN